MCITFWHQWPDDRSPYRLAVAFNRDEEYTRRTTEAHWWPAQPTVFAGQDLMGKGTWLGVNKAGHFACVTNVRHVSVFLPHLAQLLILALLPGLIALSLYTRQRGACVGALLAAFIVLRLIRRHVRAIPSRGGLVLNFLAGKHSAAEYVQSIRDLGRACLGFNLLVYDGSEVWYYSNRSPSSPSLVPGNSPAGLSNSTLDRPWPKVVYGTEILSKVVERIESRAVTDEDVTDALLGLLANSQRIGGSNPHPETGLPRWMERRYASIWNVSRSPGGHFGTRTSTVVLIKWDGDVVFSERQWRLDGSHETARHVLRREAVPSSGVSSSDRPAHRP
eukprot:EG_transcript_16055